MGPIWAALNASGVRCEGRYFGVPLVTGRAPLRPDFPGTAQGSWGGGTNLFVTKIQPGTAGQNGLLYSTYIALPASM